MTEKANFQPSDRSLESLRQLAIDIAHGLPHGDRCPEFHDYVEAILWALSDWRGDDSIAEFCKGYDQGWDEAMVSRLDRDQLAMVIDEYMTDGGTEFRAYDLADRLLKRFIPAS